MFARGPLAQPAKTDHPAIDAAALPLGYTRLIGTVLTPEGNCAYLRLSRGEIRRVVTGDLLDGAEIAAIEDGVLLLRRGSELRRLQMPPES